MSYRPSSSQNSKCGLSVWVGASEGHIRALKTVPNFKEDMKYENESNMPIIAVYNHVFSAGWKMFSMMKQLLKGDLSMV